jgi:alpha-glucosidase (family GH31 glycosyl hydrolase)
MEVGTKHGIHFGFFQTMTQVLGWHMYSEPWFLGEERCGLFKFYANLRYKLIPYIYSSAHNASKTAVPVMRAMPLAYPNDEEGDKFIHQYMFGDFFLVSAFEDKVYLPGGEWIDYWTGKHYEGGQVIPAVCPENRGGPLFVKAGAIIPTQTVRQSIGTESPEEIIWEVFPGANAEFTLTEDDGETYAYLEGKTAETRAELIMGKNGFKIRIHPRKGSYSGMPEKRVHTVRIISAEKPSLETKGFCVTENPEEKSLTISGIPENGKITELELIRH